MGRRALFALMTVLLLLGGCKGSLEKNQRIFEEFKGAVAQAGQIKVKADIVASHDDSVMEYSLHYEKSKDTGRVEVVSPQLISGVLLTIGEDGSCVEYDGLILDTGVLADDTVSPVTSVHSVVMSIIDGHIMGIWEERLEDMSTIAVQLAISDSSSQTLWLALDTMEPIRSEIQSQGRVVISCEYLSWELA